MWLVSTMWIIIHNRMYVNVDTCRIWNSNDVLLLLTSNLIWSSHKQLAIIHTIQLLKKMQYIYIYINSLRKLAVSTPKNSVWRFRPFKPDGHPNLISIMLLFPFFFLGRGIGCGVPWRGVGVNYVFSLLVSSHGLVIINQNIHMASPIITTGNNL